MKRLYRFGLFLLALLLIGGCAAEPISPPVTPSALQPRGPNAAYTAQLWWLMLGLGAAIFVVVIELMTAALLRRRRATSATAPDTGGDIGRRWLLWGGLRVLPYRARPGR